MQDFRSELLLARSTVMIGDTHEDLRHSLTKRIALCPTFTLGPTHKAFLYFWPDGLLPLQSLFALIAMLLANEENNSSCGAPVVTALKVTHAMCVDKFFAGG